MLLSNLWNTTMATESLQNTESPSDYSHSLNTHSQNIWYFGVPIILLLGNFGNVMTLVIMHRMTSGETAMNVYFTALAVIDLVTLDIFLLGMWIRVTFEYDIRDQDNLVCKLYNWITASSTTIGGWILVGLTTHRAMSVVWPHRVNVLCTRRLVLGVIVGMTAFFAAVYSHFLYGYNLQYYNETSTYDCRMISGAYLTFFNEVFTYVDLVLYSLLPFACISFANSVLVWKLRASVREIRQNFAEKGSEQVSAREKAARSVTWTVLLVSMAYVVLTLPAAVYYVSSFAFAYYYSAAISDLESAKLYLTYTTTYMLMFCNSAVNFYLYCLTGQRFRKEFVKMFCPTWPQGA